MAVGFKPNLGMGLQSIVAGDQPPLMKPPFAFDPSGTQMGQPKKPGFFGEGGMGRYLAGAIGDMLLQNAGYDQVFAPTMQAKREQEQAQANWGLKRQAELADYAAKQKIEAQYQKPDEFTRTLIAAGIDPNSADGKAAYNARVQHWNDPMVNMTLPNGQFYSGPQSGLPTALGNGGGGVPPPQAAQTKTVNGETYNQVGGKWYEVGGPSQPATGGFRY